ncbi:protrudin-like [Dysidea avara]|uniref:protrudin-like n=1 Tax=Dysidea avara TaxID=196820 RepID=UPI0033191FA5
MARPTSVDIADVVDNYKQLLELMRPVLVCLRVASYSLSWKNDLLSIGALIACVFAVYSFETLLFTLCLIGAICLLLSRQNFIMQHHRKMEAADATESLKYIHPNNPHLEKSLVKEKHIQKIIQEYRKMLLQANNVMVQANTAIVSFYGILAWKKPLYSVSLLVALCVLCLSSIVVPVRTLLIIVVVFIFCANKEFLEWAHVWTITSWKWLRQKLSSNIFRRSTVQKQQEQQPQPHDQAAASATQSSPSVSPEVPQDHPVSETEDDKHRREEASPEPKRKRVENIGCCDKCGVSFAKLLKRKHKCNNCGRMFCGSCTVRVTKSLLGATSPAAYSEMVRVCNDCNILLEAMQKELTNYQLQQHLSLHQTANPASVQ